MKKLKLSMILILCLLVIVACSNQQPTEKLLGAEQAIPTLSPMENNNINEVYGTVEVFLNSIKDNDVKSLKGIMSEDKPYKVVRSFSSGNGTRGKEIRMDASQSHVTNQLSFLVKDETPIELGFLFQESVKNGITGLTIERLEGETIEVDSISSNQQVWNMCSGIMLKMKDQDWKAHLTVLSDTEFVLFEGGNVDDFPIGGWAVFEKNNGKYYIKGIFDLR